MLRNTPIYLTIHDAFAISHKIVRQSYCFLAKKFKQYGHIFLHDTKNIYFCTSLYTTSMKYTYLFFIASLMLLASCNKTQTSNNTGTANDSIAIAQSQDTATLSSPVTDAPNACWDTVINYLKATGDTLSALMYNGEWDDDSIHRHVFAIGEDNEMQFVTLRRIGVDDDMQLWEYDVVTDTWQHIKE